jgi:transcription elongation factor Elf1
MSRSIVALLVGSTLAVAQQITGLAQLNQVAKFAAINTQDPEYSLCTVANSYVNFCVQSIGGTDALATAAPTALAECVCCADGTAVSEVYSTCSSYLSAEEPSLSVEIDAYSTFYNACSLTSCGGSRPTRTASGQASSSAIATATATVGDDDDDATLTTSIKPSSASLSIPASITSAAAMPDSCASMVNLYSSCSNQIDGFSDMPYRQQASCYCCHTSARSLVWHDDLDNYAQTCRDWARTGEPDTIFPVASTFATFCDNFSDVCEGTVTEPPSSSETDGSGAQGGGSGNTVTVTVGSEETEQPDSGAVVIRAGCMAGLAAVMGAAVLLL